LSVLILGKIFYSSYLGFVKSLEKKIFFYITISFSCQSCFFLHFSSQVAKFLFCGNDRATVFSWGQNIFLCKWNDQTVKILLTRTKFVQNNNLLCLLTMWLFPIEWMKIANIKVSIYFNYFQTLSTEKPWKNLIKNTKLIRYLLSLERFFLFPSELIKLHIHHFLSSKISYLYDKADGSLFFSIPDMQ